MTNYNNFSVFRLMGLAFLLSGVLTGNMAAAAEKNPAEGEATVTTSLSQLSYPSGMTFGDSRLPFEQTLAFPLPLDMPVENIVLRLVYRGTYNLTKHATLHVSLNGGAEKKLVVPNDGESHVWQIPLDDPPLHSALLKMRLRGDVPVAYNHCVDLHPDSGHIHVAPTSAMSFTYKGAADTPRDAWLLLPKQVTLSLPAGPLNEHLFRTALEWTTLLERQHHTVRVTRLPELGQLVIAPASAINTALGLEPSQPLWSEPNTNLGLLAGQTHPVIAITEPYANALRFNSRWREVKEPVFIESTPPASDNTPPAITLAGAGISGEQAWMGYKMSWDGLITPWNLPHATRPEAANLQVDLPDVGAADPLRLYAYLDERLVTTALIDSSRGHTLIKVPFDVLHSDNTYRLHLDLRRISGRECNGPHDLLPVRISTNSLLEVENDPTTPDTFAEMPTALGRGFDLYLPTSYLLQPESVLPMLGHLLAGFSVPPDNYRLIVYNPHSQLEPQRLFIALGDRLPESADATLRFDQGRTQIIDQNDSVLLSEQQLEKMSTIQMVSIDDMNGLWLHPGSKPGLPELNALQLGNNDLAIFDPDHVVLTLNSHEEDLARIQYLDAPRWYDRLSRQRLYWLGGAWLVLTLGIVYLHLKSKQHRKI